jgi:predicted metalloprotease with PDZ domain
MRDTLFPVRSMQRLFQGILGSLVAWIPVLLVLCASTSNAEGPGQGLVLEGRVSTTAASSSASLSTPIIQEPGIVGIDLIISNQHYPVIQQVFPKSPAARAGLRPGDTLLAVNGETVLGKSRRQVDIMISDVPGDLVMMSIRSGRNTKQIQLRVMPLSAVSLTLKNHYLPQTASVASPAKTSIWLNDQLSQLSY